MTWWRSAVVYQVYIRSFRDSDGDGIGDLAGIRASLPYIASLGVDAIWITPFYPSPMADHGYDVANYYDIDPMFGTLGEFDSLLHDAHEHGLRVIVDVVPNHTSSEHPWFRAAIADPASPERARYYFRDQRSDGGPPNDWQSVFGGPAWTRDEASGQYYLHLFAPEQPDLDWHNPEVHDEFDRVLRFWLDRGVDGFRIDVAHGLYKDRSLADAGDGPNARTDRIWDRPEVHDVYRRWRTLVDDYPRERLLCGEVFLLDPDKVSAYVRPDELHQAFNFSLLAAPFEAKVWRDVIERSLRSHGAVNAACTWVLSNHDVVRHVTRYGGGDEGRRRAAAAVLTMLALPGTAYIYQGEELGLEQSSVPPEMRQDPIWFRTEGAMEGRDGCRTPIPWTSEPGYGFTSGEPWLPFGADAATHNVAALEGQPGSMLALYRAAIAARGRLGGPEFGWLDAPEGCLVFRREHALVALNTGEAPASLDAGGSLLLASDADVSHDGAVLTLPPDSAAWVEVPAPR